MKKELNNHHSEMIIDPDWNQLCKNKMVLDANKKATIPLCILNIIVIIIGMFKNVNDVHFGICFAYGYLCIINIIITCKYLRNMLHYKKIFPSQLVFVISFNLSILLFWLMLFNVIPFKISNMVISIVILIGGSIIGNMFLTLITLNKKKSCTYKIIAICINNKSETVDRYAINTPKEKLERKRSVAYGDDEKITIYTPVFQFIFNNKEYNASPNFSKNIPYEIGKEYEIYINPSNPFEIKVK